MKSISYQVFRSKKRKRTLSLRIDDQGRVLVYVPYKTPEGEIKGFVEGKREWIEKNLQEFTKKRQEGGRPKRFEEGEKFLYLGHKYPLEFCERNGKQPLVLFHGTFRMDSDKRGKAKALFVEWYRERAREIIRERVDHYRNRLNIVPGDVRITSAASRYGSCSPDNRLSFSWRLAMAPYQVIDYVILHELAHIKHKNHSKKFWSYLESILPDYRKHRAWLNEHDHLLKL